MKLTIRKFVHFDILALSFPIMLMAKAIVNVCRKFESAEPVVTELYAKGQMLRSNTAYRFIEKISAKVTTACNGFVSMLRSLVGTGIPSPV
jgi:hypothetical protein